MCHRGRPAGRGAKYVGYGQGEPPTGRCSR